MAISCIWRGWVGIALGDSMMGEIVLIPSYLHRVPKGERGREFEWCRWLGARVEGQEETS